MLESGSAQYSFNHLSGYYSASCWPLDSSYSSVSLPLHLRRRIPPRRTVLLLPCQNVSCNARWVRSRRANVHLQRTLPVSVPHKPTSKLPKSVSRIVHRRSRRPPLLPRRLNVLLLHQVRTAPAKAVKAPAKAPVKTLAKVPARAPIKPPTTPGLLPQRAVPFNRWLLAPLVLLQWVLPLAVQSLVECCRCRGIMLGIPSHIILYPSILI